MLSIWLMVKAIPIELNLRMGGAETHSMVLAAYGVWKIRALSLSFFLFFLSLSLSVSVLLIVLVSLLF